MFGKISASILLFLGSFFTLVLVAFFPIPKFDYDFEKFFPQDDQDLKFYQDNFKTNFGSDNDYLLMAIKNPAGEWWEASFLSKLSRIKNEIQNLEGVDSLSSIFDVKVPRITPFGLQTFPALIWENPEQLEKSKTQVSQFYGSFLAKDKKSLLFLIQNDLSLTKDQGDRLYEDILSVFDRHGIKPFAIAGKIQTQRDFVSLMQEEFKWFVGASLILMLLVLRLVFQSFWGVGVSMFVLLAGLAWAFGLLLFLGKPLDVMSVMQPTIFLIVGLSALVHYFTCLIGKLKKGRDKKHAILETFEEMTPPVALAVMTTAMGFLSLYFTSIPALKEFGLWTGIGILVLFCAILILTPGLLYFFPLSIKAKDRLGNWEKILSFLFLRLIRFKKFLLLFFGVVTGIGIMLASQLRINGYLLDNLPQDHPIQQDFRFFDTNYGGSNPLELYVKSGSKAKNLLDYEVLVAFEKIENRLLSLFGEGEYFSPLTLVKTMNQAQNQGNVKAFTLPSPGQYNRLRPYFNQVLSQAGTSVLTKDLKFGRISGRTADLGSFRMEQLRSEFNLFVQEEIDPGLFEVKWTGTAYLIDKSHRSVTSQMAKGLGGAFLLIAAIAGLLFKSLRMALVVLIPNLIPLIWMCVVMWVLGIEFKLTTAILFTVAFGIAVDDSIHFISKFKMELAKGKSVLYAIKRTFLEAGKAIVITSLILISGFGLLVFSEFGVTYYTGLLISICLVFALVADLFLLPILLFPLKKSRND